MLVELLQPAGPDLVRRLAAALMLVPRGERDGVVSAIEKRVVEMYGAAAMADLARAGAEAAPLTHVSEPKQGPGYVEQVETEYVRPPHVASVDNAAPGEKAARRARSRRA